MRQIPRLLFITPLSLPLPPIERYKGRYLPDIDLLRCHTPSDEVVRRGADVEDNRGICTYPHSRYTIDGKC